MLDCEYEHCDKEKFHQFPDDWRLGGAVCLSPAADPRWLPTTYTYYDAKYKEVWLTQGPMCDEEALDLFTWVNSFKGFNPVYITAKRPNEPVIVMLQVYYDAESDTVKDIK